MGEDCHIVTCGMCGPDLLIHPRPPCSLLSFCPSFPDFSGGGGFPLSASSQQRCKRDVIKFGLPWVPSLPHVYLMHASQLYTSVFSLPVIDCFPDRP